MTNDATKTTSTDRFSLINKFLSELLPNHQDLIPLDQDASFRRYFRVHDSDRTFILMDAPPDTESVADFIKVDLHLASIGLRVPEIICQDIENGVLLLEDLGNNTFTRLLNSGENEEDLYVHAIESLLTLHQRCASTNIDVPVYDQTLLLKEASLLTDWLYPLLHGNNLTSAQIQHYRNIWIDIFETLPTQQSALVLRDFHVDNLLLVNSKIGTECALLDFQDALIGSPAYDLVSLLQDARRDLLPGLEEKMLALYFSTMKKTNQHDFNHWYVTLAAQRHAKVLGIFSRLHLRDNKSKYLEHLPRVYRLLKNAFQHTWMRPLEDWVEEHLGDHPLLNTSHKQP